MHALIGAYSQDGHEWTDELNQVLESNCRYAVQYIQDHFPGCHVSLPQGTYMLFVECGEYLKANQMTLPELLKKPGTSASPGKMAGNSLGKTPCA